MSLENFLEVTFLTFFPLALAKAGVGGYIHSNTRNDFSISLISRDPGHRSGSVAQWLFTEICCRFPAEAEVATWG